MFVEDTISNILIENLLKAEEKVLIDILIKILGREPVAEDFKKFIKYKPDYGTEQHYILTYDGMKLGVVNFIHEMKEDRLICSVTFTPFGEKDYLEPAIINNKVNI